jgi:hypothetical protein
LAHVGSCSCYGTPYALLIQLQCFYFVQHVPFAKITLASQLG